MKFQTFFFSFVKLFCDIILANIFGGDFLIAVFINLPN